ncbi:MAG: hypothetical protein NZ853_06200 [Leptospiraceae bacterium]|nr:hypothetical protein [Leptospiraceae bacterium]MDW7976457.1 hypothetical protein [Leptospiraceae bacterium]
MHNTIQTTTSASMDLTIRSAEAVNQIQQMAIDRNQELNNRLIRFNTEQKIQDLQQEGIGRNLNVLA